MENDIKSLELGDEELALVVGGDNGNVLQTNSAEFNQYASAHGFVAVATNIAVDVPINVNINTPVNINLKYPSSHASH